MRYLFGALIFNRKFHWQVIFLHYKPRQGKAQVVETKIPRSSRSGNSNQGNSSCNSKLWCGGDGDSKRICWKSWSIYCKPKIVGGLGFQDNHNFNLAMLAKQGWYLITNSNSFLARFIKALHFPNFSFLQANKGLNPSKV